MSPLILRLLLAAKRNAFLSPPIPTDRPWTFAEMTTYVARPFTTPIKAFLMFQFVDQLEWDDLDADIPFTDD